jgi:hypothetical protein
MINDSGDIQRSVRKYDMSVLLILVAATEVISCFLEHYKGG